MNLKEFMMLHVRVDPVTHKKMKCICVDLEKSMQDYVYDLIKKSVEK